MQQSPWCPRTVGGSKQDCAVCMDVCGSEGGAIKLGCTHSFCRECIATHAARQVRHWRAGVGVGAALEAGVGVGAAHPRARGWARSQGWLGSEALPRRVLTLQQLLYTHGAPAVLQPAACSALSHAQQQWQRS